MKDLQTGVEYLWPKAKFINRKYVMDEMYENYEDGDDWQLEDEKDPFTESRDVESLIGCVAVPMQSLGYVVRRTHARNVVKGSSHRFQSSPTLGCNQKPAHAFKFKNHL